MWSACCRSIESEVVGVADTEKKRSQQMVREESAYMAPAARIPYYDLVIDHGEGAMLYDVDGNSYVDLLASASATTKRALANTMSQATTATYGFSAAASAV